MRLLFVDGSTKLETVRDLETKPRGGMVSSLFQVTDYLASQGHEVSVLSDIQTHGQTKAGVSWIDEPTGRYDVLVANRGVGDGFSRINAKVRILWTHDLPHSGFIPEPATAHAFSCVVFMSSYAEEIWRAFYKTLGKSVIIPNGVDKALFRPQSKDPNYLIYASAPNRGLDKLPLIVDSIKTRVRRPIYCKAFSRLSTLHPNEGTDTFDYKKIEDSDIDLRDPIRQEVFAEEIGKAGLMLLPSGYPEICSNVVLQGLACGTPIITTGNLGATPEWVSHGYNGSLTKYQPHDYMIHTVEMVRNAVEVLEDDEFHASLVRGALKTKVLTWEEVGKKWEKLLNRYC